MVPDVPAIIGQRLEKEIIRRGLSEPQVAYEIDISGKELRNILNGQNVDLDLIFKVCSVIGANPYSLLAQDYEAPRLHFRNITREARTIASEIEDAFVLIKDFLPKPAEIKMSEPAYQDGDPDYLIATILREVLAFTRQYGNDPAEILEAIHLPVIVINADRESFDAFLLVDKSRGAICINESSGLARIRFSLLHEIAHYIFHRHRELPVDQSTFQFYGDRIERDAFPEYLATKFAQYCLISFDDAERIWLTSHWPENLNIDLAQHLMDKTFASADVIANAVYDVAKMHRETLSYRPIRDYLRENLSYPAFDKQIQIRDFLRTQKQRLADIIEGNSDDFSQESLSDIRDILQVVPVPKRMFA